MDTLTNKITGFWYTRTLTVCQLHRCLRPFSLRKKLLKAFTKTCWSPNFFSGVKIIIFLEDFWFMQNGATPHRTKPVFSSLNEKFHGRVPCLDYLSEYGCGFNWPPYSPDINLEDFWQIKCIDNYFRPLLISKLQFKTKVVLLNYQFMSQLSQVSKIVCIKLLKRKGIILKNITANFESCTVTMSHVNNCGINSTAVINN